MLFIPAFAPAVATLKSIVRGHLPQVTSSHLSEALASAAGYRSHAALMTVLGDGTRAFEFSDEPFLHRLSELHHTGETWPGFRQVAMRSWRDSPYQSPRLQAWRNMLVAAINAGLAQGVFNLSPNGNLWPGFDPRPQGYNSHSYEVPMPGNIPGRANVRDIGFGELEVRIALWPTSNGVLEYPDQRFLSGDAVASGWLERTRGAWLMFDKRAGMQELAIRERRKKQIVDAVSIPLGYADHGKFIV